MANYTNPIYLNKDEWEELGFSKDVEWIYREDDNTLFVNKDHPNIVCPDESSRNLREVTF